MSDRSKVIPVLRHIAREIVRGIDEGRLPELRVPARSMGNVVYDRLRGYFELGDETVSRSLSARGARPFAQSLKLMATAIELVRSGDFATKREAYYVSKNWGDARFDSQRESDALLDDIEAPTASAGITREELGFIPESHGGSVAGSLVIVDTDPQLDEPLRVDCSRLGAGAYTVPRSLEHVSFESDADFVLAIETGGMFQRLKSHRFWTRRRCILVEMAGVPTRATRRFIRRLAEDLSLPIYAFTDCDPYGFANIYRTLKTGSASAAHVSHLLAVPSARFLGVTPRDIRDHHLEDATHPLSDSDRKRARDALCRDPFFRAHPQWVAAIEDLLDMGVRAEQQALAKWGLNYVIEEYLPAKLDAQDSFLP
jgi:DNA topoisomerase-6 subunit A